VLSRLSAANSFVIGVTGLTTTRIWQPAYSRITCYTETVHKTRESKQNLTLVIEEELLLAARKVAVEQRTSVNQLVREFLSDLVKEPARRRLATVRLSAAFRTGLVGVGDRSWTREDLYER
jgi:hypothetical protein